MVSPQIFHQCFVLIFFSTLLLYERQAGEAWGPFSVPEEHLGEVTTFHAERQKIPSSPALCHHTSSRTTPATNTSKTSHVIDSVTVNLLYMFHCSCQYTADVRRHTWRHCSGGLWHEDEVIAVMAVNVRTDVSDVPASHTLHLSCHPVCRLHDVCPVFTQKANDHPAGWQLMVVTLVPCTEHTDTQGGVSPQCSLLWFQRLAISRAKFGISGSRAPPAPSFSNEKDILWKCSAAQFTEQVLYILYIVQ